MHKRLFSLGALLSTCLCAAPLAHADDYLYCPHTNDYARLGDSIEQVKQKCGAPLSEMTETVTPETSREVTEFVYNFQPNTAINVGIFRMFPAGLVVNVFEGKIISIRVEGSMVEGTTYCRPDRMLRVGDNESLVYQLCGTPSVRRTNVQKITQDPVEETVLTYSESQYLPPVKLQFREGVLTAVMR